MAAGKKKSSSKRASPRRASAISGRAPASEPRTPYPSANQFLRAEAADRQQAEAGERYRVEKALRETSDRLSAIISTAAEGVITFTNHEIIDTYNTAAAIMFGYSPEEVIGQNVRMLLPEAFPEAHAHAINGGMEMHVARIIGIGRELRGRRKDGSMFPMEVSLSELHDGSQLLFTALIRDVTAHKALEKEVLDIAAQEQLRIGQDLHDSVGQELTGLGLIAQSLADVLAATGHAHGDLALKLADGIRKTLKQVRLLSRGLIPVEGDTDGLMTALDDLTAQVREQSGIICRFESRPPVDICDNVVATQLFRIAQEAIANAVKHAQPEHIDVRLQLDNNHVILAVEDDGTGFRESTRETRGIGLRIIRYRAGLINALVTITSAAGRGTVVTCRLPDGVNT